jgi:uncharacterized protein (TIGR03435 family)
MKTLCAAILLSVFILICSGDEPAPLARFEVASIKVRQMAPNSFMFRRYDHAPPFVEANGNRSTQPAHLQDLVMEAYGLTENQISGLPEWGKSPSGVVYEIEAKAEGGSTPTVTELEQMLQSLLAERFQLKVHRETKPDVPVFALVLGKDGPKFHEFHPNPDAPPAAPGGPRPFTGTTTFALMEFVKRQLDAPLVDRTGLGDAAWDFDINKLLDFNELRARTQEDRLAAQDYVLSSVRDKLGLKVESRKESMEMLVIDHVEQPSMN